MGELADVLECDGPAAGDGFDFVVDPVGVFGMLGKCLKQPHDRGGDGFASGREYRDHLVVDLLLVDRVAIVVLRVQQCRQQIVRLLTRCPPFGDDLVDQQMQIGQCPVEFAVGRQRQPVQRAEGHHHPAVHAAEDGGERVAQPLGTLVHVLAAQQAAGGDAHGDPEGLARAVDGLAGFPALGERVRLLLHDRPVRGYGVHPERGLDGAPLAPVLRPVGRGHAFLAEQALQRLPQRSGDVVVRVEGERAGQMRGSDRVQGLGPQFEAYDVAVVAQLGHEAQRVAQHGPAVAEERHSPPARGGSWSAGAAASVVSVSGFTCSTVISHLPLRC
ncbi:hypothetical protein GCM10020256_24090 [Streptomyces thermocoprophilus]